MNPRYDQLKLENQLCFPLYACSKEIVRQYRPYLESLDLTYTQYITLMVLWEKGSRNLKELGAELFLDSGTLTPVLKSLEKKGYVTRCRNELDERVLDVAITEKGLALRDRVLEFPLNEARCSRLTPEECYSLYKLLYKLLGAEE